MNNERSKVTMNLPVDFNINYKEDGTINIDIDTKVLESRIAEAVINALENYIASSKMKDIEEEFKPSSTIECITLENLDENTWFHNTCVGVDDGRINFIKFPNDLTINFVYDKDDNLIRVVNQGQICNADQIGRYILKYDIVGAFKE